MAFDDSEGPDNRHEQENQKCHKPKLKRKSLQDRIDELEETLEQIGDKADDALDPECTREELVGYLKDIADLAAGEEPDEEEDEDSDDRKTSPGLRLAMAQGNSFR